MRSTAATFASRCSALVIGVGSYRDSRLEDLSSPALEAKRVADALCDPIGCGLDPSRVECLQDADTPMIKAAIDKFANLSHDGFLIIYFAGHGISEPNSFYLCTKSTDLNDLVGSAISSTYLDDILTRSLAGRVFVILDCCSGGAFADLAPAYFRRVEPEGFRILLSSALPTRSSWERPGGRGTLFCEHFLAILRGKYPEAYDNGLLYFSSLIRELTVHMEGDAKSGRDDLPIPDLAVASAYSKDPLLFVHRGLSLNQIRVRTSRFTREQLLRSARAIGLRLVIVVAVLGSAGYAFLDHSHYLEYDERSLGYYRGYPGIRLAGFPKRLATLEVRPDELSRSSPLARRQPIVVVGDTSLFALLTKAAGPLLQARLFLAAGKQREAALALSEHQRQNPSDTEVATNLLAIRLADRGQVDFLVNLYVTNSESQVADAAIGKLYTFDADRAFKQLYTGSRPKGTSQDSQWTSCSELLGVLKKGPGAADFIRWACRQQGVPADYVFRAALCTDTLLSRSDLAALLLHGSYVNRDVGAYLNFLGAPWAGPLLLEQMESRNVTDWASPQAKYTGEIAGKLEILTSLKDFKPDGSLWRFVKAGAPSVRRAALRLIATRNPVLLANLEKNISLWQTDVEVVSILVASKVKPATFLKRFRLSEIDQANRSLLIEAWQGSGVDGKKWLNDQLLEAAKDTSLTYELMEAATACRAPDEHFIAKRVLRANPSLTDCEQAYQWLRETDPKSADDWIVSTFQRDFNLATYLLSFDELSPSDRLLAAGREMLAGSRQQRFLAASLLAAYGSPSDVQKLLENPEFEIRQMAMTQLGTNSHLREVPAPEGDAFWLERSELIRQQKVRAYFESTLNEHPGPTQRLWIPGMYRLAADPAGIFEIMSLQVWLERRTRETQL